MSANELRKELLKVMPGYSWTVHKTSNPHSVTATGIQSSGFNRLSTLQVTRTEDARGSLWYVAKSAGHGTKSPWAHANGDKTLAKALRGLQEHYQRKANTYRQLAARLEAGRKAPASEGT